MIKKCFGWFDIYYAEMLLGIAFAIMNVWIRIQLGNIQTGNKRGE